MATPTSLLSPSPPLSLLKPIKPTNKPNPFTQNSILTKPIKNYRGIHNKITKKAVLGAGFGLITLVGPAYAADVALLGQLSEPANALSLPTWAIHVSSVVEWFYTYGQASFIFRVYEVDLNGKGVEEVNDLKGRTLFFSNYHDSICCRHSKFPPGIILVDDIDIHDFHCLKSCRKDDCPVTKRLY